tara:strand:- start:391 stop:564 length:174 start_codon:yes stop_codon:yes gene_type:complete
MNDKSVRTEVFQYYEVVGSKNRKKGDEVKIKTSDGLIWNGEVINNDFVNREMEVFLY